MCDRIKLREQCIFAGKLVEIWHLRIADHGAKFLILENDDDDPFKVRDKRFGCVYWLGRICGVLRGNRDWSICNNTCSRWQRDGCYRGDRRAYTSQKKDNG